MDTRTPATHQIGGLLRDWLASHTAQRPTPITGGVKLALEAVPTYYHGTWFRSRLEADWAATLDQYRIAWTYEPETITLPSGKTYVPDFWLPDHDTWLEVKGPGVPGLDKAHELAATTDSLVIIGQPPTPSHPDGGRRNYRDNGHPTWTTTGQRAMFTPRCAHCTAGSWVAMSAPLRCRRCNTRLAGGILGSSGCEELEFCRAGLVPCPAPDHPDGRCPLWPAPAA